MGLTGQILLAVAAIAAVALLLRIFAAPLKLFLKVLLNTVIGFAALIGVNMTAAFTGISIGVNLINAVIIGVLGVPGFVLLLLSAWLFSP